MTPAPLPVPVDEIVDPFCRRIPMLYESVSPPFPVRTMSPSLEVISASFRSIPTKFPDVVPAVLAFSVILPSTVVTLLPEFMTILRPAVTSTVAEPDVVTSALALTNVTVLLASRLTSPDELIGALTFTVSGGSTSRPPAPTLIAALMSTAPPVELTLIAFNSFTPPTTPLNVVSPPAPVFTVSEKAVPAVPPP